MFNKIYEKLKTFMKNYGGFLIFLLVFGFITLGRLPYDVNMPGGLIDLSDRVEVNGEDVEIDGTFNMAYVSSVTGSIPHILLSFVIPDWDVVPTSQTTYENESVEDARKRSKLYLEQSKDYATAVAFDVAKIPYEVSNKLNYVAYIDSKARTTLKVGDDILEMNGEKVEDINVMSSLIQELEVGSKINFLVDRDGKKVKATAKTNEEDGKKYVGISAITTFDMKSDIDIDITTKSSESGPSGGLMMTLMVYNAVTKQDLTNGKDIVGTGTINLDGSVGEIGGVKYKVMGAVKEGAEIFLVPEGNYKEAIDVKKEKGYDIEIVSVKTFSDAVNYLEGLK